MALSSGYLTSKQRQIWNLKSRGLPEVNIARKLDVTRQTVHKALRAANTKIAQALQEAAKLNRIRIQTLDLHRGILKGYSSEFKTEAMITFSARNGVQIWYKHDGDCGNCDQLQTCRAILFAEAQDRNVQLPKDCEALQPSKLAEILFACLTGD